MQPAPAPEKVPGRALVFLRPGIPRDDGETTVLGAPTAVAAQIRPLECPPLDTHRSASAPPRPEQRRSRRFATGLPVELHGRTGTQRLVASDVGRHGLFVRSDQPAPERHMVRLTLHLPSGPIDATAIVSRVVVDAPRGPGMGMQFFALAADAKDRWDRFILQLEGQPIPAAEDANQQDAAPVFVVRLKDSKRLRAFWDQEITHARMTLFTPVLHPERSQVRLVVVHPVTAEEYVLRGVVESVWRERPKRMDIRFKGLTEEALGGFQRFMATGQGFVVAHTPPGPPTVSGTLLAPVQDVPVEVVAPEDIIIEADERFSYDDATRTPLEGPVPVLVGQVLESVARFEGTVWTQMCKPHHLVHVHCNQCDAVDVVFRMGGGEGPMGLLSELKPMWCSACQSLVSAPLATSALERMAILARLDPVQRDVAVPLGMLFEVASLTDAPTCPHCRMELKQNKRARLVDRKAQELMVIPGAPNVACACHACDAGEWLVELLEEAELDEDVVG